MYFVPEGRSKSLSVPEIFAVETELMLPQNRQVGIPVHWKRMLHYFIRPR
jgi:hypothetical protein